MRSNGKSTVCPGCNSTMAANAKLCLRCRYREVQERNHEIGENFYEGGWTVEEIIRFYNVTEHVVTEVLKRYRFIRVESRRQKSWRSRADYLPCGVAKKDWPFPLRRNGGPVKLTCNEDRCYHSKLGCEAYDNANGANT